MPPSHRTVTRICDGTGSVIENNTRIIDEFTTKLAAWLKRASTRALSESG